MSGLFNMDNPFWRAMGRVADLVILNVLFFICCIPIVTIGASFSALYTITLKMAKNEESYIFRGFFKAFKENFKQSTIIWLIMLVIGVILGLDLLLSNKIDLSFMKVLRYVFLVFALVYVMVLSYVFPIQSKFVNSVKNTMRNALLMSVAHFPWTVLIILISVIPVIVLFVNVNIFFTAILPIMIFIGFSLIAFGNSYIFNRIFKKYIPEETEDADAIEENDVNSGSSNSAEQIEEQK